MFVDDIPVDAQNAQQRAVWEKNYRRAKSLFYRAVVQGHTYDGINIWEPNLLIECFDDFVGFDGRILLIDEVKFYESVTGGQTTELNCVDPLCYTLQSTKDFYQAKADTSSLKYFDGNGLPFGGS